MNLVSRYGHELRGSGGNRTALRLKRPLLALPLLLALAFAGCGKRPLPVTLLQNTTPPSPEEAAAREWLATSGDFEARPYAFDDRNDPLPGRLIWLHVPDSTDWVGWEAERRRLADLLRAAWDRGASILLTGLAATLPHPMGIETVPVEQRHEIIEGTSWFFSRKRGLQGLRGHPVYADLAGGQFLWDPGQPTTTRVAGHFDGAWPEEGEVVGVEKRYITVDSDRKLAVEYGREDDGTGHLLAVGGHLHLAGSNLLAYRTDRFLWNALRYLAGEADGEATHWTKRDALPSPAPSPMGPPLAVGADPARDDADPSSGLVMETAAPDAGQQWDLAGRRILAVGTAGRGIEEVWAHPVRLLRQVRTHLRLGGSIHELNSPDRLVSAPEAVSRRFDSSLPGGRLEESVSLHPELPGGEVRYQLSGAAEDAELLVDLRLDLRWMWPYDSDATGRLFYAWDDRRGALQVWNGDSSFAAVVGADPAPGAREAAPWPGHRRLWSGLRPSLPESLTPDDSAAPDTGSAGLALRVPFSGGRVRLLFAGSSEGMLEALAAWDELHTTPGLARAASADSVRSLLERSVQLSTPDEQLNALFRWAIAGTNAFWTRTPGLGTALVAGFASTAHGWSGNQEVSGRPGYAWYFGRDAVWSAFAVNGYGDVEMVRRQLDFFHQHQDINGKIFHEISTSGVVHYDASDATPLYIMLMAHYLRASGDRAYLEENWDHVKRALDFLMSTDTDGDGLIENHNVGHGWVEGGALWGAWTSTYLAGLWQQTLLDAAWMQQLRGDGGAAQRLRAHADRVGGLLNGPFYNADRGFYHFALLPDGSFNDEMTVLPAPVAWLGHLKDEHTLPMLRDYAGNAFSTDWGMRILSAHSPSFHRRGYHQGSVWPLYTGWTALAEYRYGRPVQGYTRIMNNLLIKEHWNRGYVEEVMDGAAYEPAGVCSHQCWSETNAIHPVMEGLLGWFPDAPAGKAGLHPRLPVQWDSLEVRNLRCGEQRLSVRFVRSEERQRWVFSRSGRGSLELHFAPQLAAGERITGARVGGAELALPAGRRRGLPEPAFRLDIGDSLVLDLRTQGGLSLLPLVPRPRPGDPSGRLRIVDQSYRDGVLTAELEGPSGGSGLFRVRPLAGQDLRIEGRVYRSEGARLPVGFHVAFPPSAQDWSRTTIRIEEVP